MAGYNKLMIVAFLASLMMAISWSSVTSQDPPSPPIPTPPTDTISPNTTISTSPPYEEEEQDPIQESWIWCVESQSELDLCKQMTKFLKSLDPEGDEHTHDCTFPMEGAYSCMKKISTGAAKFAVYDGGEILEAYREYGLKPIRIEIDVDDSEKRYFGVGVIRANQCPKTLGDLKGMKSCHTGYGGASGSTLPVGYLIKNNVIPIISEDPLKPNDIESVENIFKASCAPNEDSNEICTACKTFVNCNEDDLYYDYACAFRCLVEGSGDITFTKGTIPTLYSKGGVDMPNDWLNLKDAMGYNIVCPSATNIGEVTCEVVNNYKTCNFGSCPGHTIMMWGNLSQHEIDEFNEVMDKANGNLEFIKLFSNITKTEFVTGVERSIRYNGTVEDLPGSLFTSINQIETVNNMTLIGSFAIPNNQGGSLSLLLCELRWRTMSYSQHHHLGATFYLATLCSK